MLNVSTKSNITSVPPSTTDIKLTSVSVTLNVCLDENTGTLNSMASYVLIMVCMFSCAYSKVLSSMMYVPAI